MRNAKVVASEAAVVRLERGESTNAIVGAGEAVFAGLGPGLSGHLYARALALELHARQIAFRRETSIEVRYRASSLGREPIDFLFEGGPLLLVVQPWVSLLEERRARSVAAAGGCRWAMVFNFGGPAFEARILERISRPGRPESRSRVSLASPEEFEGDGGLRSS